MNPGKRKRMDAAIKLAETDPVRHPKAGEKSDSIKHRLDDAESMIRQMAEIMARLLHDLPEFKNDEFIRHNAWFAKWNIVNAKKVLKKAEALLCARGRGEGER